MNKKISVFTIYFMNQKVYLKIFGEYDWTALHIFKNTDHQEKSENQAFLWGSLRDFREFTFLRHLVLLVSFIHTFGFFLQPFAGPELSLFKSRADS